MSGTRTAPEAPRAGPRRPLIAALGLVRGSARLVLARAALIWLGSLPALMVAWGGLLQGPARQPYYTDPGGRLPLTVLARLLRDLPEGLLAATVGATALVLLGYQVLVAGAARWLHPERPPGPRTPLARTVIREGTAYLWTMLRVVLLAAALGAVGSALIDQGAAHLELAGQRAGWTGLMLHLVLPAMKAGATLLWLSLVGAWALWCRVVLVADGRRTVRTAGWLVLRAWARHPLRGPVFTALVPLATLLASGLVLAGWRQAPPAGPALALWITLWGLSGLVRALVWHWLLRAALLLYARREMYDVRARPDRGLGLLRPVRRLLDRLPWTAGR